ncbi:MAG: hypothetical protein JST83_03105 [Bacteroidetes bacterium]|nr:hypothetical protein [Bacteroidota bacterium]
MATTETIRQYIKTISQHYFTEDDQVLLYSQIQNRVQNFNHFIVSIGQENNVLNLQVAVLTKSELYDFIMRKGHVNITRIYLKHIISIKESYTNSGSLKAFVFTLRQEYVSYSGSGVDSVRALTEFVSSINSQIGNQ